jgi:hypothetical protein
VKNYHLRHNLASWATSEDAETPKEAALKFINDPIYNHCGASYVVEVVLSPVISVLYTIRNVGGEYMVVDTVVLDDK